jgi:alpha-beta hydrolase superfamily lysophospholipase
MPVAFTEAHPIASDGTSLYAQRWAPSEGTPVAELLIVHGYMEHGARYRELGHFLAGRGIASTALDYRGHGRAAGRRGFVESFGEYHTDLEAGLQGVSDQVPRFILGHSNGGLLLLDWAGNGGAARFAVRGLIVTNPFLAMATEPPAYKVFLGRAAARIYPRLALPSGLSPQGLSRRPGIAEAYQRDPLVFTQATAGWYVEALAAQERVTHLTRIDLPLLYVYSDSDPVAAPAVNRRLAERIESPDKTVIERKNELHEVLNEVDRDALFTRVAEFVLARL